jgi:phenylalanyl-tRNA synthetase beta chain
MLCSAAELGVSKDHAGILVLPPETRSGADITKVLGLDDVVLELEITPNRPDCMGMIGIAREVSALLGTELRLPALAQEPSGGGGGLAVKLEDAEGCPRYVAHFIEGVTVGPSVGWVAARLLAAGIRPISNVVDATNYVLMETGHPLHAFDAQKVDDMTIVVRRARRGERLRTLDGVDRGLDASDLVIADPKKALAIAGVMGGEDSEVSEATTSVILESAYFDPSSIAGTSRRHGLRTEASARFERGMDPDGITFAAARCAQFISLTAGSGPSAAIVDEYPVEIEHRRITLRPSRTKQILGIDVSPQAQAERLRSLHLSVTERDGTLEVEAPGFRPDLVREIDLIEEVARLAGFDELPETLPPGATGGLEPGQRMDRTIRRELVGLGISEAWTTALASPTDLDLLGLPSDHAARPAVRLMNPMIEQEDRLRTTLIPGLLRSVARNVSHRVVDVALFELARVYEPSGERLPREPVVLAVAVTGDRRPQNWNQPARRWDFFTLKGVLEGLASAFGWGPLDLEPAEGMPFHPTRAATVSAGGTRIGALGELHPDVCERFGVPEQTVVLEIALASFLAGEEVRVKAEELPRYPSTFIDLAVVVDETTPAAAVRDSIVEAGAPELVSVRLFDRYSGEQIPAGKASLAYALELRAAERTLTDEDALVVRGRIVERLAERFDARIRG